MNAIKQSSMDFQDDRHPRGRDPNAAKVVNMDYSTAKLLHCTSKRASAPADAQPWYERAERLDYLAVERIAREMRSDYVATLLSSWARTLHALVSGGGRDGRRK